jgi:hypothetical protein
MCRFAVNSAEHSRCAHKDNLERVWKSELGSGSAGRAACDVGEASGRESSGAGRQVFGKIGIGGGPEERGGLRAAAWGTF